MISVSPNDVARLWAAGKSGPEIGDELGITHQRVYQIVRQYKLPPRKRSAPRPPKPVVIDATIAERFWSHVDRSADQCWEWRGSRTKEQYGQLRLGHNRFGLAHRVSWTLTNGPIPDRLWVLHRCDNPPCVRPDHLFLGTRSDNVRDWIAKGRKPTTHP